MAPLDHEPKVGAGPNERYAASHALPPRTACTLTYLFSPSLPSHTHRPDTGRGAITCSLSGDNKTMPLGGRDGRGMARPTAYLFDPQPASGAVSAGSSGGGGGGGGDGADARPIVALGVRLRTVSSSSAASRSRRMRKESRRLDVLHPRLRPHQASMARSPTLCLQPVLITGSLL